MWSSMSRTSSSSRTMTLIVLVFDIEDVVITVEDGILDVEDVVLDVGNVVVLEEEDN